MAVLKWLWEVWKAIGQFLGLIMLAVWTGLIYFLIVPIIWLFRPNPLRPTPDPEAESYWQNVEPDDYDLQRYRMQF